jgi:thiamine pyrophosphokinase
LFVPTIQRRDQERIVPRIVIFANGYLPDLEAAGRLLQPGDVLIAADGGTRHVLALGLLPEVIIGDLDSLSAEARGQVEAAGVRLVSYPRDKNETDLELAIQYALQQAASQVLVVGMLGQRLDHTLGNLSLLSDPTLSGADIRADDGVEQVLFCRDQVEVQGQPGDTVSLIPWGQPVQGVRTFGLKWPLSGETLLPYKTRGVSNELLGALARVSIASGLLLVLHRRIK